MADGPVTWGRPVASNRPGVYVVEWSEPLAGAPVDLSSVGKWIETLPGLRLDGRRPTSRELAARLHEFWLPGQAVLYVGMTKLSIGGRVGALYRTPLGARVPHAAGHWLKTLRGLERARIWWAETDAPEEYEDGLLAAFAEGVDASVEATPRLRDRTVILPFANLALATGARKDHGITGAFEPKPPESTQPTPGSRIVDVPEASADGAAESGSGRPMELRARLSDRPTGAPPRPARSSDPVAATPGATPGVPRPARFDITAINETLQAIACRRLIRELSVGEAAAELSAAGVFRGTRAQPVGILRDLLKQGLIVGGVQDADRRWSIRCVERSE
jgi:hypothetical protein